MRTCVLDASFLLSYFYPDEQSQEVHECFGLYERREIEYISIPLLPLEIANGLVMSVRSKRIPLEVAERLIKKFLDLKISLHPVNVEQVFVLAQKHDLTAYDASYLCLALSKGIPLLSLDKQLKELSPIPF